MRCNKLVTILFLFFNFFTSVSQNEIQDWFLFRDKNNGDLIGYKDEFSNVKIEPKFTFITSSIVFKNIIPVFEKLNLKDNEDYKTAQYYLLKNGKKVGKDSLFVFDFTLDCEQEEKIRFRDSKTDKVGFFDKNGEVVIPAVYNNASKFNNGFAIVVKDGKRVCNDGKEFSKDNQCEYWFWKGNFQIITSRNEVVLDNINLEDFINIDWYSLKINPKETSENNIEFKSLDGNFYSFINTKKEFEIWFYNEFVKKTDSNDFLNNCFENITIAKNSKMKSDEFENPKYSDFAWTIDSKEKFYVNNIKYVLNVFSKLKSEKFNVDFSKGMMPIMFEYETNKMYFDNCGEYENEKYPYFEIIISKKDYSVQHLLGFIRTNEGYKLVLIS